MSTLVTGLQPSGRLHIGNYLGAVKNMVALQDSGKYECYFFIADLHSLTEEFDPATKSKQLLEIAAEFIAAGLDPKKVSIFLQSHVPQHTALAWVFNAITPLGEMYRMTQFKDKSEAQRHNVNTGLLTYPLLMAADILLYNPKYVPVGDDQVQHLELTRTIARKFNSRFGKTFVEPQVLLTKTPRIMSLANAEKKMSKSVPESCLFISDTPEEIRKKIMRAQTDSGSEVKHDVSKKPAISNLMEIYAGVTGKTFPRIEKEFKGKRYSDFKEAVAAAVADHFAEFRTKKAALLASPAKLKAVLDEGAKNAELVASKTMDQVKKRIGLAI